jgi:hypothetical protein
MGYNERVIAKSMLVSVLLLIAVFAVAGYLGLL